MNKWTRYVTKEQAQAYAQERIREMNKHDELLARIAELQAEVQALKVADEEIDWNDPAWVGRTVEVRNYDYELWVRSILCSYRPELNRSFILHSGLGWEQCRPYTGPTRPNWIEWQCGECPVDEEDWVIVQFRNGVIATRKGRQFSWKCRVSVDDIMRYSVVVP